MEVHGLIVRVRFVYAVPSLLALVIQEELVADVEHFHELEVITLQGAPGEEHVRYLAERERGMRLQEFDIGGCDVDVPLGEVGVR